MYDDNAYHMLHWTVKIYCCGLQNVGMRASENFDNELMKTLIQSTAIINENVCNAHQVENMKVD